MLGEVILQGSSLRDEGLGWSTIFEFMRSVLPAIIAGICAKNCLFDDKTPPLSPEMLKGSPAIKVLHSVMDFNKMQQACEEAAVEDDKENDAD